MAPGGIETLVLDLALGDPAIRVVSLEGRTADLVQQWPRLALLTDRLAAMEKPAGIVPSLVKSLVSLLKNWKANAVIAHHIGPLLYGGIAARLSGIATRIHVEHDGWHYERVSQARLGRLLDLIVQPRKVAVSHGTAKKACDALRNDLIEIIPNGVDLKRFRPAGRMEARRAFGLSPSARVVGTIGRLVHVKGHDLLIEAAAFIDPDIEIAIAGDGDEMDRLKARAEALGLAGRVHFLGHCERPETLYPAFDVFCLPSRAEGFPRVLIEAQAANIPVVASNVGGVKEAVCPKTGLLVDRPDDTHLLAATIMRAFGRSMLERPRDFVDPRFSLDRTIAAYRSLAAARFAQG